MLKIDFSLKNQTKTCYRFESRKNDDLMTLYLKKSQVDDSGIDAAQGITVTIEQKGE